MFNINNLLTIFKYKNELIILCLLVIISMAISLGARSSQNCFRNYVKRNLVSILILKLKLFSRDIMCFFSKTCLLIYIY